MYMLEDADAGRIVLEYGRRFENLQGDLENALAELRDKSAGRLTIGANESSTLSLLGSETFIAHNVVSPYRGIVTASFSATRCRSTCQPP